MPSTSTGDSHPRAAGHVARTPDVRLSPHPAQASHSLSVDLRPYDPLVLLRVVRGSAHHETSRASSLSVGSSFIVSFSCWAHLTASARFRARAPRPGIRPVIPRPPAEGLAVRSRVSCRLSTTGIRFSVIRFPPRSWALLTVGLPVLRPDLDGVTAFRTHELRPGWVSPLPRGRRCSPRTG